MTTSLLDHRVTTDGKAASQRQHKCLHGGHGMAFIANKRVNGIEHWDHDKDQVKMANLLYCTNDSVGL